MGSRVIHTYNRLTTLSRRPRRFKRFSSPARESCRPLSSSLSRPQIFKTARGSFDRSPPPRSPAPPPPLLPHSQIARAAHTKPSSPTRDCVCNRCNGESSAGRRCSLLATSSSCSGLTAPEGTTALGSSPSPAIPPSVFVIVLSVPLVSAAGLDPENAQSKAMRREPAVVVVKWLLATDARVGDPLCSRLAEVPASSKRRVGARVTVSGMEMASTPDARRGIHHQQGLPVCIRVQG